MLDACCRHSAQTRTATTAATATTTTRRATENWQLAGNGRPRRLDSSAKSSSQRAGLETGEEGVRERESQREREREEEQRWGAVATLQLHSSARCVIFN